MGNHSGSLHKAETGREYGEEYQGGDAWAGSGTSIFDPVLCELMYRWFVPVNGMILDPFAGGSVRGIVAHKLGFKYTGIDLRAEQVAANIEQASKITPSNLPTWMTGDSDEVLDTISGSKFDFLFSCPPYGDLEVYSDDPADLSTMDYIKFKLSYRSIIAKACGHLCDDAFACFVVGDFREKKTGNYQNFVGDTIQAFLDAGLKLYNEAILVNAIGSLPIRAGRQFLAGRKLGKCHQNVLVFVKGDGKKAASKLGEVTLPQELLEQD